MSEEKTCATCGRRMTPRRRSAGRAEAVRYCSAACRRQRPGRADRALEAAILERLSALGVGRTICPSEAVRQLWPDLGDEALRARMERARRAARRLVAAGELEIVQRGRVADPSTARGPVRLRLPRHRKGRPP